MNRNRNQQQTEVIRGICNIINQANTLKEVLTVKNISLPGGYAETVAKNIKDINPSQLRKFFDTAKIAQQRKSFESSCNTLFTLVPQMAYSVGRELCDPNLFELIKSCIKPEKIKSFDDIDAFVNLFEYILAYSKLDEALRKRR
ncbi:MAG TPA: type III-A CRISPR-associated protein Csm2 [Acholeplasmataceae bacterium]|jgi:CRISPR-associated protein Csm2|nr:type III-A CRISPR-associated protein Csm2 [Acholeplasmataceae bacterium]